MEAVYGDVRVDVVCDGAGHYLELVVSFVCTWRFKHFVSLVYVGC